MEVTELHEAYDSPLVTDPNELINAEEPNWLVESIIPEGQVTWLYGATGIGKSLVVMNLALDVAFGTGKVFGRYDAQQANVLWLDYENGASVTMSRIDDFGYDRLGFFASHKFKIGSLVEPVSTLPEDTLKTCEFWNIGLLVIDSSGVGIEGDSNSADTFAEFARTVLNPLKKMGVTVIILDNKGKTEGRGAIGSSRKAHESAAMWELSGASVKHLTLTSRKSRFTGQSNVISLEQHLEPLSFRPGGVGISSEAETMIRKLDTLGFEEAKPTNENIKNFLIENTGEAGDTNVLREATRAMKDAGLIDSVLKTETQELPYKTDEDNQTNGG